MQRTKRKEKRGEKKYAHLKTLLFINKGGP
jgi:hypothetical protein